MLAGDALPACRGFLGGAQPFVLVVALIANSDVTVGPRPTPGRREVLAACRGGDTLVVTKLDRLARSLPEAATSSRS
jgi:hypothetical protein